MTLDIYHYVKWALDWLVCGMFLFLFAKHLFNKMRWNASVKNEILASTIEINVKRIAIDQLLEELRRSEAASLKFEEALQRLAVDFEHQRAVGAVVLRVLSAEAVDCEQLLKARDLLLAEQERTRPAMVKG